MCQCQLLRWLGSELGSYGYICSLHLGGMMKRKKTYGGLLKWSEKKKTVTVTRLVNPKSINGRLLKMLKNLFPEYEVIKGY